MGDLPLVLSQNSNIAFPKRCRKRDEIIWEQNNYCAAPQTCDLYHDSSQSAFQESSHPMRSALQALHHLSEDLRMPRQIHDFVFDQKFSSRGSAFHTNIVRPVKLEGFSLRYGRLRKKLRWLEAVCFHGYRQVRRYPFSFKITFDYTEKETPNSMGVGSQCTRYKHMLLIGRPIWHSVKTPVRSCQ